MLKKKIQKVIFLIFIAIIFLFSNYKNNTIQKLSLGSNEIILHKIRTDQNVFSGLIFYPKGIGELRSKNDILNLNEFNLDLRSLISDKKLYENATSELVFRLSKKYKLFKIDRRENFTKIFLTGNPDEIKNDINLITKNYSIYLFELLDHRIENFKNYIDNDKINFYQSSVNNAKHKNFIFLFFTIILIIIAILSFFELFKLSEKGKSETK